MKLRNTILLIASLIFYAWGEPRYVLIMLFSIFMNYLFGLALQYFDGRMAPRKVILILAVICNLSFLGFYKYANFFVNNLNELLNLHIHLEPISLPIGISFFTFHALSYIIDVYRHDTPVLRNFRDLSLYISLFPQLVAGPIIRFNTVSKQIKERVVTSALFAEGIRRFIIGLSKKVLIANPLGELADKVFVANPGDITSSTAWVGIIAYTLQIYFDFSGYSDMAIGLGKMFGFNFLENFNYPYISKSITEFWRRWHISLGSWFRDYLYIPLGGNRVSKLKFYRNILIVWTVTGFWHGASWTFLAWGFYYGIILLVEKVALSKILVRLWEPLQHLYVILVVMIGWVFFRADNFSYSFQYIKTMFGLNGKPFLENITLFYLHDYGVILLLGILFSAPIYSWVRGKLGEIKSGSIRFTIIDLFGIVIYMSLLFINIMHLVNSTYNPFIYFRF